MAKAKAGRAIHEATSLVVVSITARPGYAAPANPLFHGASITVSVGNGNGPNHSVNRRSVDSVAEILDHRDRTRAGSTAPARGLCLEEVMWPVGLDR